jgi:adenylate cyclase
MSEAQVERRLAAILAADVAGYSQMMGQDEAGTLAALKTQRSELIEPMIAKHAGRVVKLMGDGVLAEFSSVVEAPSAQPRFSARWHCTPRENGCSSVLASISGI